METGVLGVFFMKFGTNAVYYVCLIVATSLEPLRKVNIRPFRLLYITAPRFFASQHTFQLDPAIPEKFRHEPSPEHEIRLGFALQ